MDTKFLVGRFCFERAKCYHRFRNYLIDLFDYVSFHVTQITTLHSTLDGDTKKIFQSFKEENILDNLYSQFRVLMNSATSYYNEEKEIYWWNVCKLLKVLF